MSQNEVVGIHFAWALFRLADEPWQSKLWGILMWGYVPNMWHDLSWRKLVEFPPYHRPLDRKLMASMRMEFVISAREGLTFEDIDVWIQSSNKAAVKGIQWSKIPRFPYNVQVCQRFHSKQNSFEHTFMSLCHLSLPSDNIFEVLCGMWVGSWWSTFLGCNYCSKETWRCLWEAKNPIKGLQSHEVNFTIPYYTFGSLWVEAKLTGESSVDFLVNFSQYSNFHFSHLGRWLWCFQDACRQQDWTLRLPGLTIGKVGVWWTFTCRCEQKNTTAARWAAEKKPSAVLFPLTSYTGLS